MAGGLTPDERWAVIQAYGSESNAINAALERSPELQELWETQYTLAWWPRTGDFWKVFWKEALPVLGIAATPPGGTPEIEPAPRRRGSAPFSRRTLNEVQRLLGEPKVPIREIARKTNLDRKLIERIRDWLNGADYEVVEGPIEGTVVLRHK
jgi:hypothetical protein